MKDKFVLVTTEKKGVFAGVLKEHDKEKETCILGDAKMCVYWSQNVKGVLGLANTGPLVGCKITPEVQEIYLNMITSITICTENAKKNWKKDIWN
jgi:hypothetical protein